MTKCAYTVAVDVGNTAVKLAVRKETTRFHSIALDSVKWPSDAMSWVHDQIQCDRGEQPHIQWRISSVHRRAAENLIEAIDADNEDLMGPSEEPCVSIRRISYQDLPMPTRVDDPNKLGIDRLLSAFAAQQILTKQQDSQVSSGTDALSGGFVVIDAGSAITVDWVDHEGIFSGGAILPGLGLQARALATGTDALPQISWNSDRQPQLPATNTSDAIHGGILVGVAAAIDGLAIRYLQPSSNSGKIVLTGGDGATLSPHLQCLHQYVPHLVCRGLLELGS